MTFLCRGCHARNTFIFLETSWTLQHHIIPEISPDRNTQIGHLRRYQNVQLALRQQT
ncbi:hypothetical protein BGX38DRAFT_1200617 [Terfezia claveryi]|nr:hypothetical protein BGX38DRAFT_1200617 [Terfezia claveryi]